jgi:hypothetical protein
VTLSPLERHARRQRRRREEVVARWALRIVLVLVALAAGIAIGEAIHDNPRPGGTVTFQRTVSVPTVPPGSTITP